MLLVKVFKVFLCLLFFSGLSVFYKLYLYEPGYVPPSEWRKDSGKVVTDTANNIFWFVHVSDIHVSRYYDPDRITDFKKFTSETLDTINPQLVLITGDLTDAKARDLTGSMQYEDEWVTYQKILAESKVTKRYIWLDIKGNHDTFDVLGHDSKENHYMKYSGDKNTLSSSVYNVKKSFGTYSFIHVNATLAPGPRRPFNFLGYLTSTDLNRLEGAAHEAWGSNLTFWYSHYPTSTITCSQPGRLRTMLGHYGSTYMCGHLHDLGGLGPKMYAVHPNGFLEAELADWKLNRMYRVMAVDHDLVSFVDVRFDQWPVLLVTNPKPATLMTPRFEPLQRMRTSTHIRFLVFDPVPVQSVEVTVDGVALPGLAYQVRGPLWACRWNPEEYGKGGHRLEVKVVDELGRTSVQQIDFDLGDDWTYRFSKASIFFILTDFSFWLPKLFSLGVVATIVSLIVIRKCAVQIPRQSTYGHLSVQRNLFKLNLLLNDNVFFYPFLVYTINILIGPQFVGELVTGHLGVCFSHGIYLNGRFYDERQMYFNSLTALMITVFPLLLYLTTFAELRWRDGVRFADCFWPLSPLTLFQLLMVLDLMLIAVSCYNLSLSYGRWALWLNFHLGWWLPVALYLITRLWTMKTVKLKRSCVSVSAENSCSDSRGSIQQQQTSVLER